MVTINPNGNGHARDHNALQTRRLGMDALEGKIVYLARQTSPHSILVGLVTQDKQPLDITLLADTTRLPATVIYHLYHLYHPYQPYHLCRLLVDVLVLLLSTVKNVRQPGANFGGRFSFGEGARNMRIDGIRVDVDVGPGSTGSQSAVRTPSDGEDDENATMQDEASTSDSDSPSTPSTLDSDNQGPRSRPGPYSYFGRDPRCGPDGASAHRGHRYPNHSAPYTMPPPPGRRIEAFHGIEDMDMDGLNVNVRGGRACDGIGAFNYAKGIKIKGGNVFLSLD
ncbi:unnamed protein product [Cyclocybe aegerita]|uniref:Uncharacterized protein n=1 Tax=Cyclocybe aegerita TaxID=1973307 RepID=A0A8S0VU34_CYCAE|nr:unnamed protein product [Cyclocybe aegerita]